MRVCATLVWFDEPPELLYDSVRTWAALCDAVVAVDGPFAEYPTTSPESPPEQEEAITAACEDTGMALSPHLAPGLSQVEKRTFALRWAEVLTGPDDWYFSVDADESVEVVEADALELLRTTTADAAEIEAAIDIGLVPQRRLLRAIRGLGMAGLHYRAVTPDGRFLWNYPSQPAEPAVTVGVRLDHHRDRRPQARLDRQKVYYRQRVER